MDKLWLVAINFDYFLEHIVEAACDNGFVCVELYDTILKLFYLLHLFFGHFVEDCELFIDLSIIVVLHDEVAEF